MITKITVKRVDNYKEAIVALKQYGKQVEEVIQGSKKRAIYVVFGMIAIDAVIAVIGFASGVKTATIFHTIGFSVPISAPIIGYGIAKIKDDNKRLKIARSYQDGSRFEGMTEQEVIDLCNAKAAEYERINSR